MVDISQEELIRLYQLASVGKLVKGLIHNLNGLLQNLSMDIEMIHLQIPDERQADQGVIKNILPRTRRIGKETERIIELLRATSNRISFEEDNRENADLNTSIKQELLFLTSNLYFKHNVRTELDFYEGPMPLSCLPQDSILYLSWLMQALVENAEEHKVDFLGIKLKKLADDMEITLSLGGENLPQDFICRFESKEAFGESLGVEDEALGARMALTTLRANGLSVEVRSESSKINILLKAPLS